MISGMPLIPCTGARGFNILALDPGSGELHQWSYVGKYYSEKLKKKKSLPRFLRKGGY